MMITEEQAKLIRAYPPPERCGSVHPDMKWIVCNLNPHGPDARHYGNGHSWPVT